LAGEEFAAVIGGRDVRQAADARAGSGAVRIVDLDARDARERFGRGHIGQLADVLGDDRIDDLVRIFLDRLRRFETALDRGDDDRVVGRRIFGRRFDRDLPVLILRQRSRRRGQEPQGRRRTRQDYSVSH